MPAPATATIPVLSGTASTTTADAPIVPVARAPFGIDPRLVLVAGGVVTAFTGVLVAVVATSAATPVASSTITLWRCVLALPVLLLLALREMRRNGSVRRVRWADTRRALIVGGIAGGFLGADMLLWAESIRTIGAGPATVVVNVQVIIVPLIALLLWRERPPRSFWLVAPLMLAGIAVSAGAIGGGSIPAEFALYGAVAGTLAGLAYAGYLVTVRQAGMSRSGAVVTPMPWTTLLSVTAAGAVVAGIAGSVRGDLDLAPEPQSMLWLAVLALSGQVVGWWLIAVSLPHLPSELGAVILLLQPICALLIGMWLLGERPTPLQLVGCAAVVIAVAVFAGRRR